MTVNLIYAGKLRHRRYHERNHEFNYALSMFLFDVAAINETFSPISNIGIEKFNWYTFRRSDYLDNASLPLDLAARKLIKDKLGFDVQGKILLLTQLACLGYCFNPISVYFAYDKSHIDIEAIIIEVTNTPWSEKHTYVLDMRKSKLKNGIYTCKFKKELHVSPFMSMEYEYVFNFKLSDQAIIVHMESFKNNDRHFDATLSLQAIPNQPKKRMSIRYSLMTYKIASAIYWQALKLLVKGVTFHSYPKKQ